MSPTASDSQTDTQENKGVLSGLISEFSFIRGNFLLLVMSWILMDFASEMPGTYYALYVEALGGSPVIIGFIGFTQLISQSLVQFPGGYLADKYGRKWLISSMTFGIAVSNVFYAFAPNWHMIMIGAVIGALCLIYSPALHAIIMDSLPPDKRGMGFSIINLIASVSTTPSPLIMALLYTRFGLVPSMRMAYAFVVAGFLVAGFLRLRLKETVKDPERIDRRELLGSYPRAIKESFGVWKVVPRSAFVLVLIDIIMMFSIAMIMPYFVIYAVRDLGVSEVDWSLLMTSLSVSMIVLSIPCGKLIDKIGKKIPIMLSYLSLALAMLLFIYGDLPRLYISMPLVGLVLILMMSASGALTADLVPREQRGKVSGFGNFFRLVFMAFGQLIGGVLYENVSHQMPFLLQFIFVVPSILLTFFFIEEPKKKEQ